MSPVKKTARNGLSRKQPLSGVGESTRGYDRTKKNSASQRVRLAMISSFQFVLDLSFTGYPNQHMVAFIIAFPPAQILRSKFDRGAFWKARQCRPRATIQELGSLATRRANSAISEYWASGSFAAK